MTDQLVRCVKCGHKNEAKKVPHGHYFVKCSECHWPVEFKAKLLDYASEHDGYLLPKLYLASSLSTGKVR